MIVDNTDDLRESLAHSPSINFARIWGKSASLTGTLPTRSISDAQPLTESDRSRLLSRGMSKRLESHHKLSRPSPSFSPLGIGVLEETVTAFPLQSQRMNSNGENNGNRNFENGNGGEAAGALQVLLEKTTGQCEYPEMRKFLGRQPLQKRVWLLGDLPCLAFTIQELSADYASGPNIHRTNEEEIPTETKSVLELSQDFSYSYSLRAVAGLSLPVDIQIIFVSSMSRSTEESAGEKIEMSICSAEEKLFDFSFYGSFVFRHFKCKSNEFSKSAVILQIYINTK